MNNQSGKKRVSPHTNVVENLKGIGTNTLQSLRQDVLRPIDIRNQLFGNFNKSYKGEISQGESLEMSEVYSGKFAENQKLRNQLALERNLRSEEQAMAQKKTEDLRFQLHILINEVKNLAATSQDLAEEIQVATLQAPVEPGVYHIIFFEKLIEFIKDFRKKIEDASIWLHATNKRVQKKNYWSRYKKSGGKFLLSADHYLQRSAG